MKANAATRPTKGTLASSESSASKNFKRNAMFQKSALRIFERRYRLRRLVPCRAGSRVRRVDRGDRTLDRRPQPGHLSCGDGFRRHFADAGAGRKRKYKSSAQPPRGTLPCDGERDDTG